MGSPPSHPSEARDLDPTPPDPGPTSDPAPLLARTEIDTPSALVDLDRARANAQKTVTFLESHGLSWRPHVKTHKSRTIARLQLDAGARGLTVATLKEAEAMAPLRADLLLAHPPVGAARQTRLSRFLESHPLTVGLDSSESLAIVRQAARDADRTASILVEADVGMGRVGLPGPADVVSLAREVSDDPHTHFRGILFYPGHIRTRAEEQEEALQAVANRVEEMLGALHEARLPPEVVSGGSTPTLWQSHRIPGLTEIRAGTCIFHDRDTLELGVCTQDEVAYRILTSVVSTSIPGQAVVDAGSKALAKEAFRGGGEGFGQVLEHPEVVVRALSEEHGVLDLSSSNWQPCVGDQVSIIPNHVCVSVNLQDRLLAADAQGFRVVPLEARGRLP